MKKLLSAIAFVCLSLSAFGQNLTTISAANIQDLNGSKLAAGQLCFLGTDQSDNPISFGIGGGGQALRRGYCSAVTAGVVTSFTIPNPASTLPSGIYYRVTVKDSSTGQEVLRYAGVTFAGTTFNFDNYQPLIQGSSLAPLTGNSVSGNLAVTGNVAATGTVTGTNIPGTIPGTGACTNQFVRALNTAAPPTCNTVGSSDLASSLALTTPNIGAATGTSINLNGAATGSGAALTIGGTSTTTGGISDFVGASGAQNERLAVVPSDGSSAAVRVGALSVRTPSLGLLTGTQLAGIDTTGAISGLSLALGGGTALTTTNQTGTGSLVLASSPTITTLGLSGGTTNRNLRFNGSAQVINGNTTDDGTNFTTGTLIVQVKRIKANQGTSLVVGDVALSAGWGTTASVTLASGSDSGGQINILSNGTGQAANATFTLTFHDGTWTTAPICLPVRADGNSPSGSMIPNAPSATAVTFFFTGFPVAGTTYSTAFICQGR